MKVSIIVPAYKQEKSILTDLENISNVMSKTRWDYEVICVVDGNLDKTYENASKTKDPKIIVCGYDQNKGKGYAVRYGMAKSDGDFIAFIDAGMDINPNGISLILEHMIWYDADIIVASKRHSASKVHYPFVRKIYSLIYQILVRILFNLRVRDTQVGLKVFKRAVLEKVLPRLIVKKFAFDIDIFNSSFNPAKVIFNKHIWQMIFDTIAVFYRMRILKYYSNNSKRLWVYDKDLEMRVNTGEMK